MIRKKRLLSWILSAIIVLQILIIPVVPGRSAVIADAVDNAFYSENFDTTIAGATPSGWTSSSHTNSGGVVVADPVGTVGNNCYKIYTNAVSSTASPPPADMANLVKLITPQTGKFVCEWDYYSDPTIEKNIYFKLDQTGSQGYGVAINMGKTSLAYFTGTPSFQTGMTAGNWYHVKIIVDVPSNTLDVYLGGIKMNTTPVDFVRKYNAAGALFTSIDKIQITNDSSGVKKGLSYVDNIVCYPYSDITPSPSPSPSPTPLPSASPKPFLLNDSFDTYTNGTVPAGWTTSNGTRSTTTVEDKVGGVLGDKCLKINTPYIPSPAPSASPTADSVGIITKTFSPQAGIFSVETDMFADTTSARATRLVVTEGTTNFPYSVCISLSSTKLVNWDGATTIATLAGGTWYHIKLEIDVLTDTFKVYVDGVYKTELPFRNVAASLQCIGITQDGSTASPGKSGLGYLDNVQIYESTTNPGFTPEPTAVPTTVPTIAPTAVPTIAPTTVPTIVPSTSPSPTTAPTLPPGANLLDNNFDSGTIDTVPAGWTASNGAKSTTTIQARTGGAVGDKCVMFNTQLSSAVPPVDSTANLAYKFTPQLGRFVIETDMCLDPTSTKTAWIRVTDGSTFPYAVGVNLQKSVFTTWDSKPQIATGLVVGTWYHIKLDIDISSQTYSAYLDGVLKSTNLPFRPQTSPNPPLTKLDTITFGQDAGGTTIGAAGIYYIDNVKVYPLGQPEISDVLYYDANGVQISNVNNAPINTQKVLIKFVTSGGARMDAVTLNSTNIKLVMESNNNPISYDGVYDSATNSYELQLTEALDFAKNYKVSISGVKDAFGLMMNGEKNYTLTTLHQLFKVSSMAFKNFTEDEEITTLNGVSTIKGVVQLQNNSAGPQDATIVMLLYKNNTIEKIAYMHKSIGIGTEGISVGFSNMNLPADAVAQGYTIKLFVWDTLVQMHPIEHSIELKN